MTTIELFHLRRVRDKPRATALLAAHAGLTAEAALAAVHQAVGGGKPQITVADEDAARRLIAELAGTGFIARRAAGDFDAAQHASHALEAVLPHCAPGAADAAGAALLAGDWAEALALALQHLQTHRPADDAGRVLLEHAAIDTGLVRGVPGRV